MAAQKKVSSHAAYKPYEHLHHTAGSREGGKCMVRCEYIYKQRNSCSYRWQAIKWVDGADRHIYKEHPAGLSGTAWRTVSAGYAQALFVAGALTGQPTPPALTKKNKLKSKVEGQAFRTAFAPYGNNPHHLLPDATLKDGILQVTKPAPQVKDMIVQGLLDETYNMNHYENVMILPTADRDGGYMGLPSHPTNHNKLDKKILSKVLEVLQPYEAVVEAVLEKEKHDVPDSKLIKAGLENIGKVIHANIVSLGERNAIKAQYKSGQDIQVNTLAAKVGSWLGV
jgi:hypothetical protein